jgi:hypothetical protein
MQIEATASCEKGKKRHEVEINPQIFSARKRKI